MRKALEKLKRKIKRLFKIKEEFDLQAARKRSRVFVKFLMGAATVILITLLYPLSDLYGPLDVPRESEIAPQNIIAEFSFNILKDKAQVDEEKRLSLLSTPLYINYSDDIVQRELRNLDTLIGYVKQLKSYSTKDNSYQSLRDTLKARYPNISDDWLSELLSYKKLNQLAAVIDTILNEEIYYFGVIENTASLPPPGFNSIVVHKKKRDLLLVRNQLPDLPAAYARFLNELNDRTFLDDREIELYYEVGRYFIEPNVFYDKNLTQAARDSTVATISNIETQVSSGDLLAKRGAVIDGAQAKMLQAYARELQKRAAERGFFYAVLPILGRLFLVAIIIGLIYVFLYHFRPDVYWSNNKLFALLLIIGLELFLVGFIGLRLATSVYLYPIAILSILITVLYDSRLGVVITLLMAVLLGALHRFNFTITLITAVSGIVACFSAGEVRRRSEFYRIIIYLSLSNVILAFVVESLKLSPAGATMTFVGYALANGFISPIATIGILPLFESLFSFSTNITLLELADLNQPLLKRLAMEAPGTYHHSIIVGNLAEAGAKAINANPLLARVGSYYHDIGKMEIPEYFVENQLGIKSKHETLNPTMSALVLASHVKKGRIIGEEAALPDAVLNFIEEHHGTTRMSYFYNKAKEMKLPIDSDGDFRYPGPKPQSKETAIVMLADSTEAASRTLDNPTPARISNLIQRLINDKFTSGELTQCNLTLKDLNDIKEAFVSILIGVFHHRIPYPKREEEEPAR